MADTWRRCLEQAAPVSGESTFREQKDSEEGGDPDTSLGELSGEVLTSGNTTGKKTSVFGPTQAPVDQECLFWRRGQELAE